MTMQSCMCREQRYYRTFKSPTMSDAFAQQFQDVDVRFAMMQVQVVSKCDSFTHFLCGNLGFLVFSFRCIQVFPIKGYNLKSQST